MGSGTPPPDVTAPRKDTAGWRPLSFQRRDPRANIHIDLLLQLRSPERSPSFDIELELEGQYAQHSKHLSDWIL